MSSLDLSVKHKYKKIIKTIIKLHRTQHIYIYIYIYVCIYIYACVAMMEDISCRTVAWMALNWSTYFNHVGLSSPCTYFAICHNIPFWRNVLLPYVQRAKLWSIDVIIFSPASDQCTFHASVELCSDMLSTRWNKMHMISQCQLFIIHDDVIE